MVEYLSRLFGICLSAFVGSRNFSFHFLGVRRERESVILDTISEMLGDYAARPQTACSLSAKA